MATIDSPVDASGTRTRFTGSLRDVSIGDLFQTLEMAAKPSEIEFDTDVGPALVWFRDRAVIDAECAGVTGPEAVYRLAMADDGTFIARFKESARPPRIQTPPQYLLMEAARRRDEWQERAGDRLRPATRLVARGGADGAITEGERSLLDRLDGEVQLVDLIAPGDEAATALFAPLHALLDRGLLEVVERPHLSTLVMHEDAVADPVAAAVPMIEPFWERAFVTYLVLDRTPRRAALRVIALNVLILSGVLGLAWWSWRVLVGGQLLGWSLLLVGHALSRYPQLVFLRPLHVLVEPLVIIADLLDRAGVKVDFVRRGRAIVRDRQP